MSTQDLKITPKKMIQNPLNHRSLLESRGCMDHVFDWYGFLEVLVDFVSKAILSKKWQLIKLFPFCFLGRRTKKRCLSNYFSKNNRTSIKSGASIRCCFLFRTFPFGNGENRAGPKSLAFGRSRITRCEICSFPKAGSMRWYHTSIVSYHQTNNVFFDSLSWNVLKSRKKNKIPNPINWWSWTYSVTPDSFWEFGEPDPKGFWNAKMVCRDQTRFTRGSKYQRYEKSMKV